MAMFIYSSLIFRTGRKSCRNKQINYIYRVLSSKIPFVEFYNRITGHTIPEDQLSYLAKKHPHIDNLSHERLQCTLQILQKFNITALEACQNLHVFSMNPISMDNYGEILKECGFINITAKHIIKYHTISKSKTIANLKKEGLISNDFVLEHKLLDFFNEWPMEERKLMGYPENSSTLLTIRTSILERYLKWRLAISTEEFGKYCRNYLPLRHRPMADIQEAINLAKNKINFDNKAIRRNGFIISSDPLNTKLILDNVKTLSGLDIRDAIRLEPAILKNNFNALLQIRDILEANRIPIEAQRKYLKVYCMHPDTVKERLDELKELKEYKILSTNPRLLGMVVHKKKMMSRLNKIQAAKKTCYSFNHLVSSNKVFNNYITSFGSKVCSKDIAALIYSSLHQNLTDNPKTSLNSIVVQLKRHKFCLHVALAAIDDSIQYLKEKFDEQVILNNCQIILYPLSEVDHNINTLLELRSARDGKGKLDQVDPSYTNLQYNSLTDNQILSLVLYTIEKRYHFSGDGIWTR